MKIEKLACPSCSAPLSGDFAPNQKIECDHCSVPLILTDVNTEYPIFCPKCHTLNGDEVRFCNHCGQQLKVDCILCHTQNRIDTNYCAKCGVHLQRAKTKRRWLREADSLLRQERLEILKEKEARQRQERLERLIEALDEPENHDFAIYQLNQIGTEAVKALVETLLYDEDVDARYGAARALGQIVAEQEVTVLSKARKSTVRALVKALDDPELPVRYWAAAALGKCGSNLAIEPLAKLLKEPHKGIRQVARTALENIGGKRVAEILNLKKSPKKLGWIWRRSA